MIKEVNRVYNALEKDIAVVNIFFGTETAHGIEAMIKIIAHNLIVCLKEFRKSKRMTITNFIAGLGGFFGLGLGFSLISFFEIFYWFSIVLCRNIAK